MKESRQPTQGRRRFPYQDRFYWFRRHRFMGLRKFFSATVGSNLEHSRVQIKRKAPEILGFQELLVDISGIEPLIS